MSKDLELHKHSHFDELRKEWQIHADLLEGKHETLTKAKYLWPHELEMSGKVGAQQIREIRQQRTRYVNFFRPILSRYVSLIFQNNLTIPESVEKFFGDYMHDVTTHGDSLDVFVRKIAEHYFLYGRPIVRTDTFSDLEDNNRPFFELINPLSFPDWSGDSNQLEMARIEFEEIKKRSSSKEAPERILRSLEYRVEESGVVVDTYSKDGDSWSLDTSLDLDIGTLPIATIEPAQSMFSGLADQALLIHNIQSALDNVLLYQAYQRIFIASDEISSEDRFAMTEHTTTFIPGDATVTSVEPGTFTSLENRYQQSIMALFQTAFNQTRILNADSRQVESADTQREQKEDLLAKLRTATREISLVVNRSIGHWAMMLGESVPEERVSISDDITLEDTEESLRMYQAMQDRIAKYPTWQKEMDMAWARKMNPENIESILEEIQDADLARATSREDIISRLSQGD